MDIDVDEFVGRYVAVWNEPDPDRRHSAVAELWAEDCVEFTDAGEYRGRSALQARVTEVHKQVVEQGGFVFRAAGDAVGHHDAIRFTTYMAPTRGGEIAWTGFVFVRLDEDGLILQDYQFGDAPTAGVAKGNPPGTKAVVEEFLRRSGLGNPEHIAELYAPKVDWRVNWPVVNHPTVPWIRPRSSRADVADHFHTFSEHCLPAESHVSIDHIVVDGVDAVLIGTSSQVVKSTGKRFVMTFALNLAVEGGLITRHHMYEDSLAVAEAFNLS
ncbi:Ketosteroid isomerase-related protein [Saccharopolyspora antimicrobica]|uniref:Ketosteroid isomerase-like protein n=1 Tax=Saccharopolyspora antimicrobica TaxID=455193 RepID=A0A1I5HPG3_9PSEU|nr:nuclear transport factor 2 family protein [Saccharopolyspora antimicrobica]RKT82398.1 ketosteroid isomerase-like protein [Saccharopolyspora antimicrobica]SFO50208.1 Ketosteroid isomerase-related protein [Saccharopolyspora antimicrobica]